MKKSKLQNLFIVAILVLTSFTQIIAADIISGRVYEGDKGTEPPAAKALSGVTITLFVSNHANNIGIPFGSTTTNSEGWYGLTAPTDYEYYTIVETDPSGYYSVGASSVDGTVMTDNKILFTYGPPLSDQTLTGNKFWDKADTPANNPPHADANGPYSGTVGQSITLDGSGSYDLDVGDFIASYEWDIDNDGEYDDATGVSAQYTWNSAYNGTIGLRVRDSYGETDTDQTSVFISRGDPEIDIRGNGISISNGDNTPSTADWTDMGSMEINTGSITKTFYIHNTGSDTLTITDIGLNPDTHYQSGSLAATFGLIPDLMKIAPGSSSSLGVVFYPYQIGTWGTTLTIGNNDSDENPFTFDVQGKGSESAEVYDYGDAPDPGYPTLSANNGARHRIDPDVFLGTRIDAESDGQANSGASGDDDDGSDDDDGVVIKASLVAASSVNVEVTASLAGYLNAWVDFNQNGSWAEAGDHIFINTPLTAGLNNLTINVPGDAIPGNTFSRFRFSRSENLSYEGGAADGEVEDYVVEIDEGGQGASVGDFVWDDLNQNGLQESGEQGIDGVSVKLYNQTNNLIAETITNATGNYLFTGVSPGGYYIRFTLKHDYNFSPSDMGADDTIDSDAESSTGDTQPFILSAGDHKPEMDAGMYLADEILGFDFGDAPDSPESPEYPTLLANNGARHVIKTGFYLGAGIDAESDGLPSLLADGDNNNGFNDEDGVSISPFIAPGQAVPITIVASDTGVINAWLDFNVDGDWADAGEHFITAQPLIPGANSFTFIVPGGAMQGLTFARFRFSSIRDLSYNGLAPDGEVEDYPIEIVEGDEGSIVVIKEATPEDNTVFLFCTQLSSGFFNLFCTPLQDPLNDKMTILNPDKVMSISESSIPGWTSTDITITGDVDNGSVINLVNRTVDVDYDEGEHIVITFKNEKTENDDLFDFGDAPDPAYPTLLASNGARHKISPNLYLGNSVDPEPEGQASSKADGDDKNALFPGTPFPSGDEDGVLLPSVITAGQTMLMVVTTHGSGVLNGWLDYNCDGDWEDAGEHIVSNESVGGALNVLTIGVPVNAQAGQSYARFRLSSAKDIGYDGSASDGEVEDYAIGILEGDGGSITIIKDATPKDDTPFWISTVYGANGGAANYRDPSSNTSIISNGPAGIYSISEIVPAGWTLNGITLSGDSDNGSVVDISKANVQIDLDTGEDITVVFKNDKTGGGDEFDFGDAPSPFPTKLADLGAYHSIDPTFKFGKFIDAEIDGLPDPDAQGDDKDNLDDESEMKYVPGTLYFLNSTLDLAAYSPIELLLAVDWERDGSWDNNFISFTIYNDNPVPIAIDLGAMTASVSLSPGIYNARWRCYRDSGYVPSPTGYGGVGEVEDCQFVVSGDEVVEYDYGDAPLPFPTQIQVSPINRYGDRHPILPGIHLGQMVDPETNGQPDPNAIGDDDDGSDDEDGVVFTSNLIPGQMVNLDVIASVEGYLNGYIDLNHDQDWDDPDEHIFIEKPLSAGLNSLSFILPANAQPGVCFARFRFSSQKLYMSLPQQNVFLAIDGEVEDYKLFIDDGGEGPPLKWNQPPLFTEDPDYPFAPCFMGWDEYSVDNERIVADDWFCTDPRPVTAIHWWGSYIAWDSVHAPPQAPSEFHIGIWTDNAATKDMPWRHPGVMLWEWHVPIEKLNERSVGADFFSAEMEKPDTCFQYDFLIPEAQWFYQNGDSNIYWLSIAAVYDVLPDSFLWGWQTREHYFHADAVRILNPGVITVGSTIVSAEPIEDMWDLAFVLTSNEYLNEFDYGDAPDSRYPTLFGQNGAHHIYTPEIYLGSGVDPEVEGQPDPGSLGDDNDGNDDEDGVFFMSKLKPGNPADLEVIASSEGFLNAWMDFNNNGSWADANEQIFTDQALVPGTNLLTFNVPSSDFAGNTFSRFRFSREAHVPYYGLAMDGEVEDYYIEVYPTAVNEIDDPNPSEFKLMQNIPNPFNSATEILYAIPRQVFVRLALYNLTGQQVAILVNEQKSPGSYMVTWNGKDEQGQQLASGIYLYRIEAGNFKASGKLLLLE